MDKAHFADALTAMYLALNKYQGAFRARFESVLASDPVTGDNWLTSVRGLMGLLTSESGSLNCGDMDGAIRAMVRSAGFSDEVAEGL